ncbi:kinesin-like protein KIN-5B [Heracleum sosnowskyi]|uniref:Kinesin-like protein KIN-5B n=1 Tax=Heracleum sosnowskyi TaxID=360622 RepID=A0AAD8IVA8_9APIA|nr:kinesin-like protein KIN-5B [Heracleum sosnowskyi]
MSQTPDQRKVGLGAVAPSPLPFLTPRPDRRRVAIIDWNHSNRELNVQVILRCRPLGEDDQRSNVPMVVTCNEHRREVSIAQNVANRQVDKVFSFDKVFGPKAQQRSIYDQAISPIVNEVLEGFNCTVFAYGQTGTGKTYTMEGGMRNKSGELPAEAGVIPRAVRQIFDTLEGQNADYSMKVTFLELYNEEITDLLAPEDCSRSFGESTKKTVSLMEDGKGCVLLRGLEEEAVYSANEIHNLLERGAVKRRTADTLLNKRSSRSHSVFTITVYVKEATVGGEELIKCGKLNLVDLAGSENISRSGSRESRAREAGEINKSLLTLGRVINALVEHSVHVPYRDSKLTRLLRDSLGGKTKTCIIATISPSAQCLDETLSTLDYAHRAKNIKNKPEANQKVSKVVLLRDLHMEIDRMRQDVRAAREKNGVYIPHERFTQDEAEKKAKSEKIEQLEIDLSISEKQVGKFRQLYFNEQKQRLNFENELRDCKISLENNNKVLQELQENHRKAISMLKEKEFIISKLLHSENSLVESAKDLRANLQIASEDITTLYSKIDKKSRLEAENQGLLLEFGSQLDQSLKNLHKTILGSVSQQQQELKCMDENFDSFLASKFDVAQALESRIAKMTNICTSGVAILKELAETMQMKSYSNLEQMTCTISVQAASVEKFLSTAVLEAKDVNSEILNSLSEQRLLLANSAQKEEERLHRALASARGISKATVDFFNDVSSHASNLAEMLEESQKYKSNQLAEFVKMFKEEAAKEEQLAMEKIAATLADLTTKRVAIVSEASKNIENTNLQENKVFLQEMSKMQQVSVSANKELNDFAERMKIQFIEETFTSAETKAMIAGCIEECENKADYSMKHWNNAELSINQLNRNSAAKAESILRENKCDQQAAYDMFVSKCLSTNSEYKAKSDEMQTAVNDSLAMDHETKKHYDSMSSLCLEQLERTREKHSECIFNIRNRVEHCLRKDYLIDQQTTPQKRIITIPSLDSIEEMRTQVSDLENRTKLCKNDAKTNGVYEQQQVLGSPPNRAPFAEVNGVRD